LSIQLLERRFNGLQLSEMTGGFQRDNAALAGAAGQALSETPLSEARVREALAAVSLPGRMERIQSSPVVLLDGAHNPDKMGATQRAMQAIPAQRRIAVMAMKQGKDVGPVLRLVAKSADHIIFTRFYDKGPWRAVSPMTLQAWLPAGGVSSEVIDDPLVATREALKQANDADLVWVTGSLYLVGDVRALWVPVETLLTPS